MEQYVKIHENTYFDSVTLMLISSKLNEIPGIQEAAVMMGTDHNKRLMLNSGILDANAAQNARPNDMVVGILAQTQDVIAEALRRLDALIQEKDSESETKAQNPLSLEAACKSQPESNFCVISLPGKFAGREAMQAMKRGMHVLLFSDNVDLDTEIRLKDYALSHGLLMMGPDCGTAIVNGVALGFANRVRRGNIGLVAAAGTGLQEVAVLIHRMGQGVSQALGTGGRDGKAEVGGRMLLQCLEALRQDDATKVIGMICKPPAPEVAEKLMNALANTGKPAVACFLGAEGRDTTSVHFARTLEDTAAMLCALSQGKALSERAAYPVPKSVPAISDLRAGFAPGQRYLRGLYSGGTLCYEAMLLLRQQGIDTFSNIAPSKALQLADPETSRANCLVDMGDDYFTNGMPHPMIDNRLRAARILREAADPETAVILLDCVLGYGSSPDPAGELAKAITQARAQRRAEGNIAYVASVCGTDEDIQCRRQQKEILEHCGVIVLESNAQAVRYAAKLVGIRG